MRKTKILSVANQKGGSGKSTHTMSIGVTLATEFQKKVLLVDCDRQRSIMHRAEMEEEGPLAVDVMELILHDDEARSDRGVESWLTRLEKTFQKNMGKYDYIFVDIPGYIDSNIVTVFAYTDIVVVPVRMSDLDAHSSFRFITETMYTVTEMKRKLKQPFQIYAMLNMVTNRKATRQIGEFIELVKIPLLQEGVRFRDKHYDEDLSLTKGITRGNKEHEIYKITSEILELEL